MEPTRVYERGPVSVEWRPELCIHCEKCITGLPEVFNIDARPWVNMEGASLEEIKEQVADCPTGALSLGGNQ